MASAPTGSTTYSRRKMEATWKFIKRFKYDLILVAIYSLMVFSPIFYDDWDFFTYAGIVLGLCGLTLTADSIDRDEPSGSLFSFAELWNDIKEIRARRK